MPNGVPHKDELKAAVIAALLQGQSATAVAKDYNLPLGTVKTWRRDVRPSILDQPEKKELGVLIGEYLRENLVTLRLQQEFFRDPAWLRQQSAAEVAVLHGVSMDKAIRLLEALEAGGNDTDD